MKILSKEYKTDEGNILNYYEVENKKRPLIMLHGQQVESLTFKNTLGRLSKYYHIYLIDYYGHGKSSHVKEKYNLIGIGNDIIEFIKKEIKEEYVILGHSSGGLIAAYVASNSKKCEYLVLEDPPFFSSLGERRYNTYNYVDLSTICHNFLNQTEETDFPYYYFENQYAWNYFPDESRDKIKEKLCACAKKYRTKHKDKTMKVPFWPSNLFQGLNEYDPNFGENFYNDKFNEGVDYDELLRNIECNTLIMKANTTIGKDGLLQGAMSDDDLTKCMNLISNVRVEHFNCGHGIHVDKKNQFIENLININKELER